ncbi:MAG: cupin domain-containing protein [Halodesulfurarchaeum sp.]
MGYHVISPDDLEPTPDRPSTQRAVSDEADLENFALNVYEAQPGEQIPLAYHLHTTQEEAMYVLDGTLTIETPEGDRVLGPDEVFIAEPGSPHRAYNPDDAEEPVRVIAVGAPRVDDAEPYEP